MGNMLICPKCGNFFHSESKFPVCSFCEYENIIETCSLHDYGQLPTAKAMEEFEEQLREQYVYNSPEFDKVLYNRRLNKEQEKHAADEKRWAEEAQKPRCPKCLSLNVTDNPKGFSAGKAIAGVALAGGVGALAGFMGSKKIKLTCLECGHSWTAGK